MKSGPTIPWQPGSAFVSSSSPNSCYQLWFSNLCLRFLEFKATLHNQIHLLILFWKQHVRFRLNCKLSLLFSSKNCHFINLLCYLFSSLFKIGFLLIYRLRVSKLSDCFPSLFVILSFVLNWTGFSFSKFTLYKSIHLINLHFNQFLWLVFIIQQ